MSRSHWKLMAAMTGLVLTVVLVTGALAERRIRSHETERTAQDLEERAALVVELARGIPFSRERMAELDALADRAGAASSARISLISPDGWVVGDSDVPRERLAELESHATRPEVRTALAGSVGRSERRSGTVGRSLLYVAVPVDAGTGGVARTAMDLSALEAAIADLRRRLAAAAAVGVVGALALSTLIAWYAVRPLRDLDRLTAALASGDLDPRLPRRFDAEFGTIAESIRRLAEQLRAQLDQARSDKERLQAVLDGMDAVERMRRDFVANASHELRTPLAAIRGFAETLLGSGDLSEADQRSYIEIIDRHSRRLAHLVNDLLELSRIESGKAQLERTPVEVGARIDALLEERRPNAAERSLELSRELKEPTTVLGDTVALEQILSNLLDNAIQYTEPGGRIVLRAEPEGSRVRIQVEDDGIGIPERDLARIFERFYRVDKARSRELGGTGLGLAIVKHLTQSLGGEISVESELGNGTTFTLLLPRA